MYFKLSFYFSQWLKHKIFRYYFQNGIKLICVFILFLIQIKPVTGTGRDHLGYGLMIGGQRIVGEGYVRSNSGFGVDGIVAYRFPRHRFGLMTSFGICQLLSRAELRNMPVTTTATNLFTFDLKGFLNLMPAGKVNPFIVSGVGLINTFKSNVPDARPIDGAFILGGGLALQVHPKVALMIMTDYRYTTSDQLDGYVSEMTDGYYNFRVGMVYNLRAATSKRVAENDPNEFLPETPVSAADSTQKFRQNQSDYTIEEFTILQNRLDKLNEMISQKESEINEFKTQIQKKQEYLTQIEKQGRKSQPWLNMPVQSSGNFEVDYQAGLQAIYDHDQNTALAIFSQLLNSGPNHPLASNCQYWIGEANFSAGNVQASIPAFQAVFEYENSYKHDDALLMLGKAHIKLRDYEAAQQCFRQLLQNYPDSEYVERAEDLLDQLLE